ncbi:MAG: hypothetical protein WEB07_03970, partial [Natronospirillum sp.]
MSSFEWVSSSTRLSELVDLWLQKDFVVLDTEFIRRRTYYAELGLLQVADGEGYYLIDPLAIADLADLLRPLLVSERVEKVFHSGEEDLEILGLLLGEPLRYGMDTQLAWGFITSDASVGYARMVETELGVEVPKDQTQSNWLQRPLSEQQCQYAVNDVVYLYQLYPALRSRLQALGRHEWVREDVDRIARKVLERQAEDYYQNLRQAWSLTGKRLWLLQQLAAERERRCQALNVNRKALISDPDVALLAEKRPSDLGHIASLTAISPSVLRRESDWIIALIERSQHVTKADYPEQVQGPLPREYADDFQSVRQHLQQIAET